MSDVNDIWDDEEDNEIVREMFGRRKAKDDYEHVNKPSKWIADKDAEITRLRAENGKLLEAYNLDKNEVYLINSLRLKAFKTNSDKDKLEYFKCLSRWFQNLDPIIFARAAIEGVAKKDGTGNE